MQHFIKKSEGQQTQLEVAISDLRLHTMTLDVKEQERFSALLEATDKDFIYLNDKLEKIKAIKKPYQQSERNVLWAKTLHHRIKSKLIKINNMIKQLENVMRIVVNAELDKHQERMTYYLAQARLGKARLYDQTLNSIEDDAMRNAGAMK